MARMRARWFEGILTAIWLSVAGGLTALGLEYYRLPGDARLYSPLHQTFGPAGVVGQGLGVIGTLLVLIGVVVYGVRKRVRTLARFGSLRRWLQFHIFLCTLGPFLVLLHTTFKFGGLVSIAFWSMTAVVASGVFGRYVYARIPKTVHGRFLDLKALEERRQEMFEELARLSGLPQPALAAAVAEHRPAPTTGFTAALTRAALFDLSKRRRLHRVRRSLATAGVTAPHARAVSGLLADEMRLELQVALLKPFQRMFRYWHAFHLPLALLMLLIVGVHVGVAIMFGYTWIF